MGKDQSVKASLILCTLILVHAAAYVARPILAPLVFSIFIVAVVWPLQRSLQKHIPHFIALLITLLVTLSVFLMLALLVIWAFSHIAQWAIINASRFQQIYLIALNTLEERGVAVRSVMAANFDTNWITGALRHAGGQGYALVSFLILVFTFTVLGLLEVELTRQNIGRLSAVASRERLLRFAEETSSKLQRYMAVRTQMSLLTGAVVWAFALVAGIELATAWGVLAFVLNYIPVIGPLFATVFPSLFALAQFESPGLAILVLVCLNGIQFFIGSYLEPRVAGARLSLSPFMVLLAVFFWSFLWGIAGAFIGVPILIVIETVCSQHNGSRWLATLMSGGGANANALVPIAHSQIPARDVPQFETKAPDLCATDAAETRVLIDPSAEAN